MTQRATGPFDVKLVPQPAAENVGDPSVGRLSIDKQFQGDLVGTSKGEMLSILSQALKSGGYVAMERFVGTLHGRRGSFALLHRGLMTRGVPELLVTVVPDSGTDELAGLTGTLAIQIVDGKHSYDFEYSLPEKP